jgi:hypothetical protein
MSEAFAGVHLIRLDVDQWGWGVPGTGFKVEAIPIFFKVDDQGQPTGEVIDGNAWGENIPKNMAPPLKDFFRP